MSSFSKAISVVVLMAMVLIMGQAAKAGDVDVTVTSQPQMNYHIGYFFVQHRKYESGREINRVLFEIYDENGNYVLAPVDIAFVELVLPDASTVMVDPSQVTFFKELFMGPVYNGDTGQWNYEDAFYYTSGYYFDLDPAFVMNGDYGLEVTDTDGNVYLPYPDNQFFHFYGIEDLPIIPKSSIKYKIDAYGNLISTWDVPYYIDPNLSTSARAIIEFSKDGHYVGELHVKVPSHLGTLFVPAYIVDLMQQQGDEFEMRLQLRTNDNNNRTYSAARKLNRLKVHGKKKK